MTQKLVEQTGTRFINPTTLMRIKSLQMRARTVVEGLWCGLHRSPYYGFSVEFTEYRQYSAGDDPRYIDWRLFARSDRYYIKRFEDETNLKCRLLLDASRSMCYGSLAYTKEDYAKTLAATLAHFLIAQRDAVGLATFDERVTQFIPARYRPGQLRSLLVALERPFHGAATSLSTPLEEIAERLTKRGLIVVISDFLAPIDHWERLLRRLTARRHEVLVFQILDPAEIDFPFEQATLFFDLESQRQMYVDPVRARKVYRSSFAKHQAGLRATCARLGASYCCFITNQPLDQRLAEFLRERSHREGKSATRSLRTATPSAHVTSESADESSLGRIPA